MAPTETLAEQHFLTVEAICTQLGVRVALLTSSRAGPRHDLTRQLIASGDVAIAVGTHALIQKRRRLPRSGRRGGRRAAPLRRRQRSALAEGRTRTSCT